MHMIVVWEFCLKSLCFSGSSSGGTCSCGILILSCGIVFFFCIIFLELWYPWLLFFYFSVFSFSLNNVDMSNSFNEVVASSDKVDELVKSLSLSSKIFSWSSMKTNKIWLPYISVWTRTFFLLKHKIWNDVFCIPHCKVLKKINTKNRSYTFRLFQ